MEYPKTDEQPISTCPSGPEHGRSLTSPEPVPPQPYDPILLFKPEKRWEQIFDMDGSLWEVREARATKHGFDLLFGFPANSRLPGLITNCGPNRLIATPALVSYWEAHRFSEGATYDLPAGRTTLKRVRTRLHLNFVRDRRNLWKTRAADLQKLPIREFAERYHVTPEKANSWSLKLFGRNARPLNWWRHPKALQVLRDPGLKLREIGQALRIGTSHANRLRKRALALDPKLLDQQQQEQKTPGPIATLRFPRKPAIPPAPRENPFRNHRKQGEMFIGQEFWRLRRKPLPGPSEESTKTTTASAPAERKRRRGSMHSHSKLTAKKTGQALLPFDPPRGPQPRPVLFQTQDAAGTFYDVYETRPTDHGFALLFGYPARAHRHLYTAVGKPGLIATSELIGYWEAHRTDLHANFDLPAGRTTLMRVRHRFCFNVVSDQEAVWRQRIPDLQILPISEFAKKYQVTYSAAAKWRRKLLGPARRPPVSLSRKEDA